MLVHHPYDSFDASVGAFAKAARDPKVGALKATVYRTDDSSPTLSSLVETAEEGKQAVCLVELKARFDERRNIEWSRALERAGVDVVYGVPDLKVHAKLALLVRHEQDGAAPLRPHRHRELPRVERLELRGPRPVHGRRGHRRRRRRRVQRRHRAVARRPCSASCSSGRGSSATAILQRDRAGRRRAARAGEVARIRIKVNSLVDEEIIEALYVASAAGATVEIVTRGICCPPAGRRPA